MSPARKPLPALVRRVVHWLLGDLPTLPRHPESALLAIWVCSVAALGMWLGAKHPCTGGPMPVGSWRMLVHGAIPLAGVAMWELRAAAKAQRLTVVGTGALSVGALLLLAPILARLHTPTFTLIVADPVMGMIVPAAAGAVLVWAGLRAVGGSPSDWGIGLGDWRWWLPHHGVLLTLLVPVLVAVTFAVPALANHYPMHRSARKSLDGLANSQLAIAVDFVGWEFLFRGFLLFAIARRGDSLLAVLLSALPFFLLHEPKPDLEMISSYAGGIFAGWFCLRAGSFVPLYIIHVVIITVVSVTAYYIRHR